MSDFIYKNAARRHEEEPDDEYGKCDECGQRECVCSQLDGLDDDCDRCW